MTHNSIKNKFIGVYYLPALGRYKFKASLDYSKVCLNKTNKTKPFLHKAFLS